jgi:beta-aspartyl-peptidase (threonine type)
MQLIVHGGAGDAPDEPGPRQTTLEEAATTGVTQQTPLDAVVAAVRILESDDRFNAGVGGAVQSDGVVRTDAGLMTDDRQVGAVAGLPNVEHAVQVARLVLEETPHVLLAGSPAVSFAEAYDVETAGELLTDDTRERFRAADPPSGTPRDHLPWVRGAYGRSHPDGVSTPGSDHDPSLSERELDSSPPSGDHDTVGAVAADGTSFAAGTSTAGRWFALAGRVGDVPQVGSGFYCAPAGGASATGAGEDIARVLLSRRAVGHLESGLDAQAAANRALEEFAELTGSDAGVVVLDEDGVGSAFNTEAMQTAVARD